MNDVGYSTPGEVLTAYREALSLRAFMDDRFLSQVQEVTVTRGNERGMIYMAQAPRRHSL